MPNMRPEDFEAFLSQLGESPSGGDGLAPTAPGSATGLGSLPASSLPPMPSQAAPVSNNQISLPSGGDGLAPTAPGSATGLGALGPTNAPDSGNVVSQFIAKKYGVSPISDNQALLAAQQLGQANRNAANIGAAFSTFAHGLSGSRAPIDNTNFHNMASQADDEAKNVIQRRQGEVQDQALKKEQEADDPNSPMAQQVRSIYAPTMKRFGMDPAVLANMSADQIKNFAQQPLEQQARLAMIEATKAQTLEAQKERGVKSRNDAADKALQSAQTLLESARGNPAAAQAEKDIYAADKANSLANLYGDPNKLSMPQVKLLAGEIGKIAQGQAPTMSELEGITPNTLTGRLSVVVSNLTNEPTPAHAAAFVKQYQDYANALKKDAQKVIEDKYGRVIEARRSQLGDENYNSLKTQYIDRFKQGAQSGLGSKPASVIQNGHTYNLNPQTGQYE